MQTNHRGYDVSLDHSLPLFIMGIIMFVFIFFNDLFLAILRKVGLAKEEKEEEVDEKLGTYIQCLGNKNRKVWRIEEQHRRKEFGIKVLDDTTLEALRDNKPHNKLIKTCHNYELTANMKYAAAFQYTPIEMRDTPEEKHTSDMVAKMLYLAYFSELQCKINGTYIIIEKNILFKGAENIFKKKLFDLGVKKNDF